MSFLKAASDDNKNMIPKNSFSFTAMSLLGQISFLSSSNFPAAERSWWGQCLFRFKHNKFKLRLCLCSSSQFIHFSFDIAVFSPVPVELKYDQIWWSLYLVDVLTSCALLCFCMQLIFKGVTLERDRSSLHFPSKRHVFTSVSIGDAAPPRQVCSVSLT